MCIGWWSQREQPLLSQSPAVEPCTGGTSQHLALTAARELQLDRFSEVPFGVSEVITVG